MKRIIKYLTLLALSSAFSHKLAADDCTDMTDFIASQSVSQVSDSTLPAIGNFASVKLSVVCPDCFKLFPYYTKAKSLATKLTDYKSTVMSATSTADDATKKKKCDCLKPDGPNSQSYGFHCKGQYSNFGGYDDIYDSVQKTNDALAICYSDHSADSKYKVTNGLQKCITDVKATLTTDLTVDTSKLTGDIKTTIENLKEDIGNIHTGVTNAESCCTSIYSGTNGLSTVCNPIYQHESQMIEMCQNPAYRNTPTCQNLDNTITC